MKQNGTKNIENFIKEIEKWGTWNIKKTKIKMKRSRVRLDNTLWKSYQWSARLLKYGKYYILTADLYQAIKLCDEELYIRETFHQHL